MPLTSLVTLYIRNTRKDTPKLQVLHRGGEEAAHAAGAAGLRRGSAGRAPGARRAGPRGGEARRPQLAGLPGERTSQARVAWVAKRGIYGPFIPDHDH